MCKIFDYNKFRYQSEKKHKKQKQIKIKEIRLRPVTDEGDYQTKLRNAIRFLTQGDKVKVTMKFKGREITHQEIGRNLLNRLETDLSTVGTVEQYPKLEGKQITMVLKHV